jgi:hypothetical protein
MSLLQEIQIADQNLTSTRGGGQFTGVMRASITCGNAEYSGWRQVIGRWSLVVGRWSLVVGRRCRTTRQPGWFSTLRHSVALSKDVKESFEELS